LEVIILPVIDMPLNELKTYNGINPKPSNFDKFWDESLDEMNSINSKIEIKKSDFQIPFADCYDLYFTGVGNSRIYAKFINPKNIKEKAPAIIKFHGYTGNSGDWYSLLPYASMGYIVAAMDCRGQGGKSEDLIPVTGNTMFGQIVKGIDSNPKNLTFRNIFLDTAQLAKIIINMDEVDKEKIGVTGGSQGGALTIACSALEPSVKKSAPVFPFLSDYKRIWEMDLAKDAYQGITDYLRRFDPTHSNIEEFFMKLGYIDVQHLASRIKGEVLFFTGLMDTICPPSTQFAIYNKITSKKRMVIYPDFSHEYLPGQADSEIQFFTKF
jgi:cephalosporin-C deacetylase